MYIKLLRFVTRGCMLRGLVGSHPEFSDVLACCTMSLSELELSYGIGAKPRVAYDFYVEDQRAVRALCTVEGFVGSVWDPACGSGALLQTLRESGIVETYGTDIRTGGPASDFLASTLELPPGPPANIVTNPPFSLALPFVHRALGFASAKACFFLRLQFLEGGRRYEKLFATRPPNRVWVLSDRVGMTKNGLTHAGGMLAHAWFVWDQTTRAAQPALGWLRCARVHGT